MQSSAVENCCKIGKIESEAKFAIVVVHFNLSFFNIPII